MTDARTFELAVTRTARIAVRGEPSRAREVWILLHGYAQSANEMLDACSALATGERMLVAPEGLSRFYRRGSSGPIGASWMTREAREQEIADYVAYLDRVAAWCDAELGGRALPRRALGFSQGAATLWRWAESGASAIDTLIAWGGGIPPDLEIAAARAKLSRMRLVCVRGSGDPYFTAEWLAKDLERARAAGVALESIEFDGRHELRAEILLDPRVSALGDGAAGNR